MNSPYVRTAYQGPIRGSVDNVFDVKKHLHEHFRDWDVQLDSQGVDVEKIMKRLGLERDYKLASRDYTFNPLTKLFSKIKQSQIKNLIERIEDTPDRYDASLKMMSPDVELAEGELGVANYLSVLVNKINDLHAHYGIRVDPAYIIIGGTSRPDGEVLGRTVGSHIDMKYNPSVNDFDTYTLYPSYDALVKKSIELSEEPTTVVTE